LPYDFSIEALEERMDRVDFYTRGSAAILNLGAIAVIAMDVVGIVTETRTIYIELRNLVRLIV
jgi:hypothetical protein